MTVNKIAKEANFTAPAEFWNGEKLPWFSSKLEQVGDHCFYFSIPIMILEFRIINSDGSENNFEDCIEEFKLNCKRSYLYSNNYFKYVFDFKFHKVLKEKLSKIRPKAKLIWDLCGSENKKLKFFGLEQL